MFLLYTFISDRPTTIYRPALTCNDERLSSWRLPPVMCGLEGYRLVGVWEVTTEARCLLEQGLFSRLPEQCSGGLSA